MIYFLITYTSARLPPRSVVSLGTDRFTCLFILRIHYITLRNTVRWARVLIDPLPPVRLRLIELVSPSLPVFHWAPVNPDDKRRDIWKINVTNMKLKVQ